MPSFFSELSLFFNSLITSPIPTVTNLAADAWHFVLSIDVMKLLANVVGVFAVALFLLSYLQKDRKRIIALNAASRCLYILQYVMLGAFAGAVLDIAGTASSLLAQKKDKPFIKKHLPVFIIGVNTLIVGAGILTIFLTANGESVLRWATLIDFLPIAGVLLHTSAFWIDDEKTIRRVSLLGSPFWFAYNLISGAFGSCIGDLLSMVSILVAMFRYDFKRKKKKQ